MWTEFREYYGYTSLREVFSGSFIIVNDHLHGEFKQFSKNVSSYTNASYNMVKSNELIKIWLKSCSTTLKSVNVLGNKYFLMDESDLDALCLWIYRKRKYCFDKEVTKENLLQPSEPKNSISVPEDNVLLCFDENASDDILMRIVENEQISQICYMPVCKEWQKDHCNSLGLPYIHGNIEHHTTKVMVPVNLCPSSTARIVADGNCFFRSLSFVLSGSQDYRQEVRLLVTTYMIDNMGNPQLSSLIKNGERMENYIEQSKMQLLGTWATEIEIIASALLLQTTIHVYGPCGKSNKWQKHAFESEEANIHYNECIYITNISNHFETVKKM